MTAPVKCTHPDELQSKVQLRGGADSKRIRCAVCNNVAIERACPACDAGYLDWTGRKRFPSCSEPCGAKLAKRRRRLRLQAARKELANEQRG